MLRMCDVDEYPTPRDTIANIERLKTELDTDIPCENILGLVIVSNSRPSSPPPLSARGTPFVARVFFAFVVPA